MIGYTPKRRVEDHPHDAGFKVSKYGTQESVDHWDTDCGNGKYSDGSLITGNDPLDTGIVIDETFVTAWIDRLIGRYGTAEKGGIIFYSLDSEPFLWNHTHRDVQPAAFMRSYRGLIFPFFRYDRGCFFWFFNYNDSYREWRLIIFCVNE
jgi:hypothetical protein